MNKKKKTKDIVVSPEVHRFLFRMAHKLSEETDTRITPNYILTANLQNIKTGVVMEMWGKEKEKEK